MTSPIPLSRRRLIDTIARRVRQRLPKPDMPTGVAIARQYFSGVAEEDLAAQGAEKLSQIFLSHIEFGLRRTKNRPSVSVFDPDTEAGTQNPKRTQVFIVCDDMPFLVDSIRSAVTEAGLGVHLIVHPVLHLRRQRGRLESVDTRAAADGVAESWQWLEIDHEPDEEKRSFLEQRILAVLDDVRCAVEDWPAMCARALEIAASVRVDPSVSSRSEADEVGSLLEWMVDHHFTFLGVRYYRLQRGRRSDRLVADTATGLGILRPHRLSHGGRKANSRSLTGGAQAQARSPELCTITKANSISTVHRATHLDYVGIKTYDRRGRVTGEHRILGLWAASAYHRSPLNIPLLRRKVSRLIRHFALPPTSHDSRALVHAIEDYPRDELFQARIEDLIPTIRGIVNLYDRRIVRAFVRRDWFHRYWSCLLYIPRDTYSTSTQTRIESIVRDMLKGHAVESRVFLSESSLAQLHLIVHTGPASPPADALAIEARIRSAVLTWTEALAQALVQQCGEERGADLLARFGRALPAAFQEETSPADAAADLDHLATTDQSGADTVVRFGQRPDRPSVVNLRLYRRTAPRAVADVVATFENLGLRLLNERPYEISARDGAPYFIQDFELEIRDPRITADAADLRRLKEALAVLWRGEADNDGFNRLVLAAKLDWRQATVLRAYVRWLLQTGLPFSSGYVERVLNENASIARQLVLLFLARFEPNVTERIRQRNLAACASGLDSALTAVTRLDEDRILRTLRVSVDATLRTNYFQTDRSGAPKPHLSMKLNPAAVPGLPEPRPMFEIWVHSPHVDGVHLRKGRVARGGLRWSDRYEDFRTEILGLMKAQNVKNTVIVPVGAKGGFVCRQLPAARDGQAAAVVACYRTFIRGLLDLTDNIVDGRIVPPQDTVRHDADDPYLVVAADKGTATFSDIANRIAEEYGFWLGDAFASGGSAGYDHKKMAITARGAWESVKRHFRELGLDAERDDFSVAGIGDMSGDVFGNGLLRSKHARLVAAFNHQHIFIDPDPEPIASYEERARLYGLERSTWGDYDVRRISAGGGVWSRAEKSIRLPKRAQSLLGLAADAATPNDVIRAILRLNVDLLWNGGIGTYVKAGSESNGQVGDRANDALRVDGKELRCRVVGEGGNLGFTQLGRVEYALNGGRINTDFIDNSGGVNCSDLEVNIKILLRLAADRRGLKRAVRDRLLASMTEDVAALVLRNNYLQTQAISALEARAREQSVGHRHTITALERGGYLDRGLEFLPTDEQLQDRMRSGQGLSRPELAILLSYSKIFLYQHVVDSDVPEDPYLSNELERYFPAKLYRRYQDLLADHPLRREIIATATTNSIVNRMGPVFPLRVAEDTGEPLSRIVRAYAVARESLAMRSVWSEIESLDNRVSTTLQYDMAITTARALRHATYWLLAHRGGALAVEPAVAALRPGIAAFLDGIERWLSADAAARLAQTASQLAQGGVPAALARMMAKLEYAQASLYVVELSTRLERPIDLVGRTYLELERTLGIDDLRARIQSMALTGHWQSVARNSLRDDLFTLHAAMTESVLIADTNRGTSASVDHWLGRREAVVAHFRSIAAEVASSPDFATLSVALQALKRVAQAT